MSIEQVIGPKPDWYGDIKNAWFAKDTACQNHDIPSFHGYMNLYDALEDYPDTIGDDWEVLSVDAVEECTIFWPESQRPTGEQE